MQCGSCDRTNQAADEMMLLTSIGNPAGPGLRETLTRAQPSLFLGCRHDSTATALLMLVNGCSRIGHVLTTECSSRVREAAHKATVNALPWPWCIRVRMLPPGAPSTTALPRPPNIIPATRGGSCSSCSNCGACQRPGWSIRCDCRTGCDSSKGHRRGAGISGDRWVW